MRQVDQEMKKLKP
jgi:hypothetical protein